MPAHNPPRWITVIKAPFNYYWPDRSAVSCVRETGETFEKAELCDYAVSNGYAIEGRGAGSKTRSRKGKSPARPKRVTAKRDAGPDKRYGAGMGRADLAADDSAGAGQPVAPAAD